MNNKTHNTTPNRTTLTMTNAQKNSMKDIEPIRDAIKKIDHEILSLLSKRNALSQEIGKLKINNDTPINDPSREQYLMDNYKKLSVSFDLNFEVIQKISQLIITESKRIQSAGHKADIS